MESYHFIGIGGIGMSGLAKILLGRGHRVSGSDQASSYVVEDLKKAGAKIFIGHKASQVPPDAKVVYSTDIKESNEEYQEAKRESLTLLHRSQMLQALMEERKSLLVAGTHGKTTTSSLLSYVLTFAGLDPSYYVGGIVRNLGSQASEGRGDYFVAEADESDGSFLAYIPCGAIVTNIDDDHLNFWQTREMLVEGFATFLSSVQEKELLFWCADDPVLASQRPEGVSYGFAPTASLHIEEARYFPGKTVFSLSFEGRSYKDLEMNLLGRHNVQNAAAVVGLCLRLGVEKSKIYEALASFCGAKRRMERVGEGRGITLYDDYGHHPTEILTTLQGVRANLLKGRLVVLFQPHRYTRTRDCFDLFAPALSVGDLVFVTDIYEAGEEKIEGVESSLLVQEARARGLEHIHYIAKQRLLEEVLPLLQEGDVVLTMGAGDITRVGPQLLAGLAYETT